METAIVVGSKGERAAAEQFQGLSVQFQAGLELDGIPFADLALREPREADKQQVAQEVTLQAGDVRDLR